MQVCALPDSMTCKCALDDFLLLLFDTFACRVVFSTVPFDPTVVCPIVLKLPVPDELLPPVLVLLNKLA